MIELRFIYSDFKVVFYSNLGQVHDHVLFKSADLHMKMWHRTNEQKAQKTHKRLY